MPDQNGNLYPIDKPLSERLNMLRVILTVFIVYIHVTIDEVNFADGIFIAGEQPVWLWAVKTAISGVIARVAVPLFFLISAVLLYRKPFTWAGNLKKKCISILIPYLFWNTFWLFFFFVAQKFSFTQPYFATRIIRDYSPLQLLAAYFPIPGMDASPFYYPFWFLFDLFMLNLLAKVIKILADKFPVLFTSSCFVAWLFSLDLFFIKSESLLFFLLGYLIVKHRLDVKVLDSIAMPDLFAAWLVSVFVATPLFHGYRILLKAAILVGILFFIRLSGVIVLRGGRRFKSLFYSIFPYVFIIYAAHDWIGRIFGKFMIRMLPQTPFIQLAEYLAIPVAAIFVCVIFGMAFRKALPQLYGLVTGNR